MVNRQGPGLALRSGKLRIMVRTTTDRIEVGRLTKSQVEAALKVEDLPDGWTIARSGARRVSLKGPPLTPGKVLRIPFTTEQQSVRLTFNLFRGGRSYMDFATRLRRPG